MSTSSLAKAKAKAKAEYSLSLRHAALIAGIAYLIAIFVTPYSWISPHIIIGDTATTFESISTHEFLFRLAIACWLIVIVADIVVAWALFHFFLPVNKSLSMLSMILRLIFAPIMAIAVLQWLYALQIITDAGSLAGDSLETAKDQSMFFFSSYEYAVNIAFVVFGHHVGLTGYLVWRSNYVPSILGLLLMIAGVGYQIDTFASVISSGYAVNPLGFIVTVAVPAFFSEFILALWLLIKGARLSESAE